MLHTFTKAHKDTMNKKEHFLCYVHHHDMWATQHVTNETVPKTLAMLHAVPHLPRKAGMDAAGLGGVVASPQRSLGIAS